MYLYKYYAVVVPGVGGVGVAAAAFPVFIAFSICLSFAFYCI